MRHSLPQLYVNGWFYVSALSLEGEKGWLGFLLCSRVPRVRDVNQPTKRGHQSNRWRVYKEEQCQIISWHCKEYKSHAEICLNDNSDEIICLPRNEIHSCPVFLQPQQIQACQTEVRKNRIITIVWNLAFVNKLINISMLKYLGLWKSLYDLTYIIRRRILDRITIMLRNR